MKIFFYMIRECGRSKKASSRYFNSRIVPSMLPFWMLPFRFSWRLCFAVRDCLLGSLVILINLRIRVVMLYKKSAVKFSFIFRSFCFAFVTVLASSSGNLGPKVGGDIGIAPMSRLARRRRRVLFCSRGASASASPGLCRSKISTSDIAVICVSISILAEYPRLFLDLQ